MAQVTVRINGYGYTVGCQDGEEQHLQQMAEQVERRIDSIKAVAGQSGESRMLVMAALLMADDLYEMGKTLKASQSGAPCGRRHACPATRREAEPSTRQTGQTRRGHCSGAWPALGRGGGAAGCVRQFIPWADKHPPGRWRCRDRGLGIWCPPAQAGSGRVRRQRLRRLRTCVAI